MSLADKVTQLRTIRSEIRAALVEKEVAASDHDFADFAEDIESITGGGNQPTLNAPSITFANKKDLTITNPSTNGNFVTGYKIFAGATEIATVSSTSVDLTTVYTTTGTHTITVKACGTNFVDSAASNSITYIYPLKLDTPVASVSETTVSWGAVTSATSYDIMMSGVLWTTVSTTSHDLSTDAGWASLTDGTYPITVIAKASGWTDSDASASVNIVKISVQPYLMFCADGAFTLHTWDNAQHWDGTIQYSTDKTTWSSWNGSSISCSSDNKLYLRGVNNTHVCTDTSNSAFRMDGSTYNVMECTGNIEMLLDYETAIAGNHPTTADYAFNCMFYGASRLISAPDIECPTLLNNACYSMFEECTSLQVPPKILSTKANLQTFRRMFFGCTSLHTLPKIYVTEYSSLSGKVNMFTVMFNGCTNIKVYNTTDVSHPYEWSIPVSGTTNVTNTANYDSILSGTGGDLISTFYPNRIYYTDHQPV